MFIQIYDSRNYLVFIDCLRGGLTYIPIYDSRNYLVFIDVGEFSSAFMIYDSRNYLVFIDTKYGRTDALNLR